MKTFFDKLRTGISATLIALVVFVFLLLSVPLLFVIFIASLIDPNAKTTDKDALTNQIKSIKAKIKTMKG